MDIYPWWTDKHISFEQEVNEFVKEVMPIDEATKWKREFPWEIFEKISEKGYTGAGVPTEFGGMGLGATGACIAAEAFCRMTGPGRVFVGNMLGGLRQIIEFGTEKQKKHYLPKITKGELGAVVITETFAGTDAAAMELFAKQEGDGFVLDGKKRFIVSAGIAQRYLVYARTSDNTEDRKKYRHLTAFVVEKGTPGFSAEKINEIIGFENIQNGVLNFDNVKVPTQNVIGQIGDGWNVLTAGLNFERTLISAQSVGWMRELLRYSVPYSQRRVQFGKPIISFVNNKFKVADLITRLKIARLMTYYTAHLWDLGWDITVESNVAKVFNCEAVMSSSLDAIQIMGGDGLTPFNPPAAIMNLAKVENIAGGTMEACRLVIQRSGTKQMADDIKMPIRSIHDELGVPISSVPKSKNETTANELLKVLAEDYRVNPGLHMSREDLKNFVNIEDKALDELLLELEKSGHVILNRDRKGIALAKATYQGLKHAFPNEHYQWFPHWVKDEYVM